VNKPVGKMHPGCGRG